jgi:hypothetical protein
MCKWEGTGSPCVPILHHCWWRGKQCAPRHSGRTCLPVLCILLGTACFKQCHVFLECTFRFFFWAPFPQSLVTLLYSHLFGGGLPTWGEPVKWLGYELETGVQVLAEAVKGIISSPPRPDRLWGPPSLLSNGYRKLFRRRWSSWGVKLTTHLHLAPRLRMRRPVPPFPHTSSWHVA